MLFLNKLLDAVKNLVLYNKSIEKPIFIKDFTEENPLLRDLTDLSQKVSSYKKELILRDIKLLRYGIFGEKKVYFQLKNSFVPMLCLHDIRIEHKEFCAQLDFIVITNKFIYILENKNLYGDIEITRDGNFIRIIKDDTGHILKKEGMDSPIIQNRRHINILKDFLKGNNISINVPIKSFIVFTNQKSLIHKDKAPINIKHSLIKHDQISSLIEYDLKNNRNTSLINNKEMYDVANILKSNHIEKKYNLQGKYNLTSKDYINSTKNSSNDLKIYKELKKYRYNTSKQKNIPPYYVFKDSELDLLVSLKPKTQKDLITIYGAYDKRIYLYGEDLLDIINSHSA